jgi:hypothetical protein
VVPRDEDLLCVLPLVFPRRERQKLFGRGHSVVLSQLVHQTCTTLLLVALSLDQVYQYPFPGRL